MTKETEALKAAPIRLIAGKSIEEWVFFARRDDCLDNMVPSDLRSIVGFAAAALRATSQPVGDGECVEAVIQGFWLDLCEKDDRTSPKEYPDMCLISENELGNMLRYVAALSTPTPTDEMATLLAAGVDEYAAICALRTDPDGGFCSAYFYSDGLWRFKTGGHDVVLDSGKTARCLLTKRLYSAPTTDAVGLREAAEALLDRLYRSHLPSDPALKYASVEWQDARAKADALRAALTPSPVAERETRHG